MQTQSSRSCRPITTSRTKRSSRARSSRPSRSIEASKSQSITFLGVSPDTADPELGYIVPGMRQADGSSRIARFVEKPVRSIAARLVRQRALWNSFILVARASALVELIERRYPVEVAAFRSVWRQTALTDRLPRELARLYERSGDRLLAERRRRHRRPARRGRRSALRLERSRYAAARRRVPGAARPRGRVTTHADAGARRTRAALHRHFNLAEAHARLMSRPAAAAQSA